VKELDLWQDVKGGEGSLDLATSYRVESLTPDVWYGFRARARNVHGWSDWSSEYSHHTSSWPS